ncbi:MAG: UDP-3-O-(3-hydroxymyristoyl)glucosamine N-acyltransferase [Nitrospiraceae bacterium]
MLSPRAASPISLARIHDLIGGQLIGSRDATVSGLSSLEEAGQTDLAYVAVDRFHKVASVSRAGALIVNRHIVELDRPQIVLSNPAYAFAQVAQHFFTPPLRRRGVAAETVRGCDVLIGSEPSVWPFVTLGDRVKLGNRVTLFPGVFIGDDSVIGDDTLLYPNVVVREGCTIGARVIIHSGSVIGGDGFGYVQHQGHHYKIPQLGGVTVEDDVELGANVTIDRATLGRTIIKRGTKIDNLVQIAHNVSVGEDNIVVAQVGIAGSTTLGHHVMVGGQAGLSDHIHVGDNVMIAARSGVTRNLEPNQIVSGAPVMPHEVFIKAQAIIPRLPELRQRVRELEGRIQELETRVAATRKSRKKNR